MHGKQAGDAFHHHFAGVVFGFADQRDARLGVAGGHVAHPLRAGARFAGAAAAENEPGGPVGAAVGALGRALVGVRELTKIDPEVFNLAER